MTELQKMGAAAKEAAAVLRTAGEKKRRALLEAAQALRAETARILEANALDLAAARESGMRDAMLDRLTLTAARVEAMAQGVEDVAAQRDPVGRVLSGETRPNGLKIEKITVPMGVIGIIFEARPNVTSDAAALCLMAGSAVILRGGKEALHSNTAVTAVLQEALARTGLPREAVQLARDTSRESSREMMGLVAEIGISTQKLHARGPMGLNEIVSYKYVIRGDGQVR